MRIALLTEGGYPYARGESVVWCDRLLRGLEGHEFEIYALSRSARQEAGGWCELPSHVGPVRTARLWGADPGATAPGGPAALGRRARRRFAECFGQLAQAVCTPDPEEGAPAGKHLADRFATGLYGLAELAAECRGGLAAALRSEQALRILESACREPGALRAAHGARVTDLLAVAERLERALRPLSLDWYRGEGAAADGSSSADGAGVSETGAASWTGGLASADLCHVVGSGAAALPGLLAKRLHGTPLLVTEYTVRLREHYLAGAADAVAPAAARAPVRALLASFQGRLARETYRQAQLITPGSTHVRRWQERCGARREQLRTVYPGMDAAPFAEAGERAGEEPAREAGHSPPTLVWVGRVEPAKDLIALLHAFARVRERVPGARLRLVRNAPGRGQDAEAYAAHCRALAAQLFPDEAAGPHAVGECPVSFEEAGSPEAPTVAEAYADASVVVLSSVVEGFPVPLAEAMLCGSATVSTDAGAVCEVIGGTGLVVPARNPRALADACVALLRDPERRARLGAAARARALELFTVEQNIAAFHGIYLELMSHHPVRHGRAPLDGAGGALPFARPAESHVPGRWVGTGQERSEAAGRRAGGRLSGLFPGVRRRGHEPEGGPRETGPPGAEGERRDPVAVGAGPGTPGEEERA
ncbi:DUF3492 domain-containing protein [Streptomyces sp. ODS28]|uniref:DUF3492 domain-containing protein n=1 Tax=Streptomyces sp. ODS28 TaxID=3136688 RepID=UPI0031E75A02